MSYKVYKKGNYFIIDDYTIKSEHLAYDIEVEEVENFNFFNIRNISDPNSVIATVKINELYDEFDTLYTLQSWKDFYTANTGFTIQTAGGGGGDASASNQVITNNKLTNIESVIENNRLKVSNRPSTYPDITGDITNIQATINTPVLGGVVVGDTSMASNLMAFCTGTFSGINVTFEGSLDDIGDNNWFGVQAVRTNANTIETTTGALSAQPVYGWELSVNALKRFRVRCTARTSGTQSWKFVLGTYATEPIPASQVTATQPISGTVTANQGTMVALPAGTNAIGDVGMQYRANATGAASRFHLISAASTNLTNIKASAGRLIGWSITNTNAAWRYVKLHNLSTVPTAGASVFLTIGVPPNGSREVAIDAGIGFTTGIAISTVTGILDSDTTAIGVNDLSIDIFFA